jgi:catechol 2,3-dioxygenase-like lactoylglutathione lyase family enzyme
MGGNGRFESVAPNLSVVDLPGALDFYERVLGSSRAWTWGDPMTLASVCRDGVEITRRGATVAIRDESGNVLDFGEEKRPAETPETGPPAANAVKVFVPAKDFALSKRFYAALGFRQNWEQGALAELELGGTMLLLQNYFQKDWAENFMVHVEVPDADAWARHVAGVLADGAFPEARVQGPRHEEWDTRSPT